MRIHMHINGDKIFIVLGLKDEAVILKAVG